MKTVIRNSYVPKLGDYCNTLVVDKETGNQYLFDKDGVWTLISTDEEGIVAEAVAQANAYTDDVAEGKVDKEEGKGLSENDFTDEDKDKLDSIEEGAQENVIETVKRNGVALPVTDKTVDVEVPTATSALTNDSGYITNAVDNLVNYYDKDETDTLLETEALTRDAADQDLQEQIDAIAASSDVVDIVGTYAELQAYDTTKLHDNDIIKVLTDSTHDDATTYYRWDTDNSSFSYIGSEGPYYTKGEADATFVPLTRTINGKGLNSDVVLTAADVNALPASTVIPTVNDATLTIQKNGTTVTTFTANSAQNATANITVPTKVSDLTNDLNFVEESDLADVAFSGDYADLTGTPTIPTKTSDLTNDSNFVSDANYVHTDNNYTTTDKNKLAGIAAGAEVNVQSDWNVTDNTSDAFIKNKPTIPTKTSDLTNDSGFITSAAVPTKTSDLTNDSGFITNQVSNLANYYDQTTINNMFNALPAVPTKTSDLTNDSGFLTTSTLPIATTSSLGVVKIGNGLSIAADGTLSSSALQSVDWADITNKPTNVSYWTNDAGYITSAALPTKTSDLTNDSGFITSASLPTKTSDLTNDSGFITNAVSNLTNYYTKSQTYTQGEVNSLLSAIVIPTKTSDLTNDGSDGTAEYLETDETAYATASIPYGKVDSTSTATAFTATVPGITQLRQGVSFWLENGVVTSAAGFTININGLGAKPVYSNMAAATRDTTIFNVAYTMLFVYDEDRVEGGAFICYRGYDANTNTIGYQLRTNSQTMPMTSITYRYRLLFTSADGAHYVPANNSTSTNATASRTVCQDPIDPFGPIFYYGTTASVAAGSRPAAANLWQQYVIALGYSFNRTNAALTLTSWKPVYVKAAPQSDGSAIIDATTPYVQDLPTTEDGKIYIFLGVAYSATNIELEADHPVYYYKDGAIRQWTNAAAGISSVAWGDITGTLSSQTDLNTALNAKANSADLATVATSGSYNDLSNKPTIPTVNNATLTIQKNSTNVATFTANAASNVTANISVPTATSDLTNDSGFLTSSTLPIATSSSLGAVQVGSGLTISSGGVLSATGGGVADSVAWGHITGTLADQTDLQDELDAKANTADLATVATSGSYNDLSNKPTIPTVNDATLTIQKNGTTVQTFTANSSTNKTANITVPTKTSDLTNDSGFLTSYTETDPIYSASPAAGITATDISSWNAKSDFSGSYNDLTDKPTIPTVGNGTLTIQKNGTNVQTFTANQSGNATANITVPTKTSELTNDSSFVTSSGTVAKADQLTTPRTIAISGGATGTATSFSGASNISIPITGMYETYLNWGNQNLSGRVSPIDAALSEEFSANRLAYMDASKITVEYSRDGGSTWTDYGLTAAQKTGLVTTLQAIHTGGTSSNAASNYQVRVNLNPTNPYMATRKLFIYISTNGVSGAQVLVERKPMGATDYETVTTATISGWSGWNSIPINITFGGTSSWSNSDLRLTFSYSGKSTSYPNAQLQINKIRLYGETAWSAPSTLATNGHLYTYDTSQNATFPANVKVTGSLQHGSYTYTLPSKNGTVAMTSDIPSALTVDSALSSTSENPVQNKVINTALSGKQASLSTAQLNAANSGITAAKVATYDGYATSITDLQTEKQDTLTAGDHISISNDTISATGYVHSENPVTAASSTATVTGSMIANGSITADKLASGATIKLTLSTTDIGEGAALAANTLYGVYQ